MSNDINSNEAIIDLVKQAKHRPLPRSTKALFVVVVFALVFTGGIAYGKHQATANTGTGLSLSALSGGGGFGGGRNRGGGGFGAVGTPSGAATSGSATGTGIATPTDVAGTIISINAKSVVVQTLAGDKQTFPIQATTRVRASAQMALTSVKPGDIVTIKPDDANNAKTITVVK